MITGTILNYNLMIQSTFFMYIYILILIMKRIYSVCKF